MINIFAVKNCSGTKCKQFDLKVCTLLIALLNHLLNGVDYSDAVTYILKLFFFSWTLVQCSWGLKPVCLWTIIDAQTAISTYTSCKWSRHKRVCHMSIQWKLQCLKWKRAFKITLFWNWMVLIWEIHNGYGTCRITSLTLFLTTALVNHWLKFSNDALHRLKSWPNICISRYLHFPFVSCIEAYRYLLSLHLIEIS